MASSRILSASSATTGLTPHGYYGYGSYGSEYAEDGSISTSAAIGHPGIRRRFSSSELSFPAVGGRKGESATSGRTKRPTKSKTSLSIAGRRQPGVLEVMSKKSSVASAKVTITQPSEDGRSLTPTPSESGLSGAGTESESRITIPEHQLRNLKLFGYKPFSGGRALSPVPDKSSMENSQADLKLDSSGSTASASATVKKGPVFNIRGLLMSPRQREKLKESSPKEPQVDGKGQPVDTQQPSRSQSKEPQPEAVGSPPKKRRFNLARAIIDSARGGPSEGEKPPPAAATAAGKSVAAAKKEKSAAGEGTELDGGERRKLALKMKLGIVRSGVRKDSEGNGVKEKKGKGKKNQPVAGKAGSAKGKGPAKGTRRNWKSGTKAGREYDDDGYDNVDENEDDYGASYGRRGLDLGPKKTPKKSARTGSTGGGMLKSALNYAASFRSRSDGRVGTAGGGRKKPSTGGEQQGAKGGPPTGGPKAKVKEKENLLTPNARRRDRSGKATQPGTGLDGRGKSGSRQARVKSGNRTQKTVSPASNRAKSAAGSRGKPLRRSSSALMIDAGQQRRMNKLYEKNTKASTGGKSSSSIVSKANRHANEGNAGQPGGTLSKTDSLRSTEQRGKGDSSSGGGGGGSDTKERFEKRDSDRSLKKSDSNKSLATMAGKPKKSDSKSSLLTKRSDSRTSLHQTASGGPGAADPPSGALGADGSSSGAELGGKSPHNSVHESAPESLPGGVKSARPTPKLQSKGSLLSLMSLKGSKRNLDRDRAGAEAGQIRPDTAASMATNVMADGTMASSTRLKSASVRNGTVEAGNEEPPGTMGEKPMSTKPLRRLMSRGSLLSIKSIAHARSFTNIRPPTAGGGADGTGTGGGGTGAGGTGEAMPPQTMTKVTEGSQEHDDTTDTETSHGGPDGAGSMGVATHELTVAGDGEGEKVSNEYNGERMRSPRAEHMQQQAPGNQTPDMDNVSSANTESMRDRTMGQGQQGAAGGAGVAGGGSNNR